MNYIANLDPNGNFKILSFDDDTANVVYHTPNVKDLNINAVQSTLKIYNIDKVYNEDTPIDALVEHKTINSLI